MEKTRDTLGDYKSFLAVLVFNVLLFGQAVDKYVEQLGDLPTVRSQFASRLEGQLTRLTCTFEPGEPCSWGNLPGNSLLWKRIRFKEPLPTRSQMKTVTSKSEMPEGAFAVVGSETPSADDETRLSVLAATIPCQNGPGKLKFNHWTNTASNGLEVCIVPIDSSYEKKCVGSVRRTSPNPIRFTVPAPKTYGPFQIRLEATGFRLPGFVAIDDISYQADLCKWEQRKPRPHAISKPGSLQASCTQLLNCDFEEGTSCFYDVKASSTGQWNVGSGRTGNRLTGVHLDGSGNARGYYAVVGRDYLSMDSDQSSRQAIYILQSPEVTIRRQVRLFYDFYIRSAGPELKVCINDMKTCPKTHYLRGYSADNDGWRRRESIILNPTTRRVLFVVSNLPANMYVALDNLAAEASHDSC
ncbi:MAM domain containing protein [Trichuris trichiura]|uniref:MAM domain containing protein n=1 Tax=Trichuris trichiura TaxID=36087 RepID=A0A077Z0S3_TRITR|nr:MAM domain containing protein [Trichuris trichiura]